MDTHRIIYLYQRWSENSITGLEQQELSWLLQDVEAEKVLKAHWDANWNNLNLENNLGAIENYESIYQTIVESPQQSRKWFNSGIYAMKMIAAASILIVLGLSLIFYFNGQEAIPTQQLTITSDIAPGGNRATLKFANGQVISLDQDKDGIIMGDTLRYSDGSTLEKMSKQVQYAVLSTPKGGQYQVVLPDGSKVWLNATSSLTYPSSFADVQERRVKLVGEAYFEIAHDKAHPFIVSTENQEVQVLGTHFNISAFPEESETKTTLVEGLVEVRPIGLMKNKSALSSLRILPNEQSVLSSGQFLKQSVNVEQVLAWKNGYFLFKDESIIRIMQDIAKWYDVDVRFEGKVSKEGFNGMISRDKPISGVLKMLEETGAVHFKVKDKTVYVY